LRNLTPFTIGNVIKKLNRIHIHINSKYNRPYPKPRFFWLSEYTYKRRYIKIHPDGRIVGGLSRFVTSLVDFSLRGRFQPVGLTGRRVGLPLRAGGRKTQILAYLLVSHGPSFSACLSLLRGGLYHKLPDMSTKIFILIGFNIIYLCFNRH